MKTALLVGASGLIGSEVLNILIDEPKYEKIHMLVRKSLNPKSPKVIEHIINFDELQSFNPGVEVDDVYCSLGTTIKKAKTKENFRKVDFDYVFALGKNALQWNAKKFMLVSALGANARSRIFYNRIKGEVEEALMKLDFQGLYFFRPSLLMGNREEQRAGEKTAIAVYKIINPLFMGPLKKYKGIDYRKVARAMVSAALNTNESFKIFESDEIQNY